MIAIAKTIQNDLDRLAVKNERIMQLAVRDWLDFVIRQLRRDLRSKFKKDITSEFTDWGAITDEGIKNIRPATLKIMQTGGKEAYNTLAVQGSFSVLNVKAVEAATTMTAKLVREVTDQTRKGIRLYVREGIKDGKSMPKLGRELRPLVGLTENQTQSVVNYRRLLEDKEKYPRLKPADIGRKVQRYADKTHRRRATNIAQTETARAQNIGYCQGLAENGVEQVEFLIAPTDACEECIALNGEKYSVAEGEGIIPVHPKCRCAMLPVIDEEAVTDQLEEPQDLVPDTPPDIPGPEGFDYEEASSNKQLNWEDKLTSAQLTSFDEYTAGETQKILAAQRRVLGGVAPSKLSAAEKVWYGHAQQIELALQRAPGFKGQVWRGLQFKNDKDPRLIALNRRLTSKKPFTFDTTTSFTGSKDFAAMVNQWDRVDDANKVKVMVRMKKAPKRSSYMGNLSGVEDEAEILVSARTKYKVVGQSEKVVGKTRYIQYDLEEIPSKLKPLARPKLRPALPQIPAPMVVEEATTVKRAEGVARNLLGVGKKSKAISYEGLDLKMANGFNKSLATMKKEFGHVPIKGINTKTFKSSADYIIANPDGTLTLNKEFFSNYDNAVKFFKKLYKNNYWLAQAPEEILYHEAAHSLVYAHLSKKYTGQKLLDMVNDITFRVKFTRGGLSRYGASSGNEGIAECFVKYFRTGSLKDVYVTENYRAIKAVDLIKKYTGITLK